MMDKPWSQACDNNKQPILELLQQEFADCRRILEIGSGTGQHAAFFATQLPWLKWQTSDLPQHHQGILSWLADAPDNALAPLVLDVSAGNWPVAGQYEALFTANTLHIMAWECVQDFFRGAAECLATGAVMCVYGPFNYGGNYTSDSNASFDQWLASRDPRSAIRDFEAVNELAAAAGFDMGGDHAMPANNRLLSWRKR